jgi:LexA-binding, inner membrane-associated putative hydrolase
VTSRLQVYSDPVQHALLAALVVAPLVPRFGRGPVATAVAAAWLIDVDHPVAARSLRLGDWTSMPVRPQTHSAAVAVGAGTLVGVAAGPAHGWAAFAGLASHLLHDAGGDGAPTPLLWPAAPARQLGRRRQLVGTVALALASAAIARISGGAARGARRRPACARGGGGAARRRTA